MSIQKLSSVLATTYENFPKGRFITLVVLRTTHSETIFRTEGSGEPLCSEFVQAGVSNDNIIQRLVMTKRKQVAPERRYGREHLRAHELLYTNIKDGSLCSLNTNSPCEMCVDCFLYGFAAGGGGAQKSRIWTEDAFSILPASDVVGDRTINAIYENGTMRDEKGNASTALNTSEYIKPGVHFLDVVTLKDVTADELRYIIGNILFTSRYGAVSSRVGRMENQILGAFGSITELPSSLELVQATYDVLGKPLEHPLNINQLSTACKQVIANWQNKRGVSLQLSESELTDLITDVETHWSEAERDNFLKRLSQSYEPFRQVAAEKKKAKGKGKNTPVEVES
ncbi:MULTISPECIES: type I-D CRISPR-associated protein Cas7/Csc2 [Nostoc]|uniref:Type I-D CRISPR-associated protein Cas7/Csc2 n=1 Tax=Nostoc paludosum FACHB-159 TaxID=2692908 RepID=A0ABR8K8A4_9NOSO|nr:MULTISPECIES: type I-D CRISPR-associated protein Cas7/Csc2 [Nostoc]MBD2679448.1 type I-D CRISPR-associated protein Cas7/Csc2 [Nostoc sp. FACHB-857]MBD2735707.1 type I-D CRISPR-associated protein Cas7/Csc2 [Nostoc paludosum FACHB-159]